MTRTDLVVLALVVFAPWALVMVVGLLRGYDVTVVVRRRRGRPRE